MIKNMLSVIADSVNISIPIIIELIAPLSK